MVQIKSEQCIILKTKDGGKVVMTNSDEIGLKEWSSSIQSAYKCSNELFSGLAKKAGKIYGADGIATTGTTGGTNLSSSTSGTTSSTTGTSILPATNTASATNNPTSSPTSLTTNATNSSQ